MMPIYKGFLEDLRGRVAFGIRMAFTPRMGPFHKMIDLLRRSSQSCFSLLDQCLQGPNFHPNSLILGQTGNQVIFLRFAFSQILDRRNRMLLDRFMGVSLPAPPLTASIMMVVVSKKGRYRSRRT